MRSPLALARVEVILKANLRFVRPSGVSFKSVDRWQAHHNAFANPASGKVKLIGLPFSKAWIARVRPFFQLLDQIAVGFVIRHATILGQADDIRRSHRLFLVNDNAGAWDERHAQGSVTRNSFVSLPFGSIKRAITSFWPDVRWPSEAVKQTSLVLISDDCSVGPFAQYRVQGEAITCTCCWPFCAASPGAPCCACPAFGPGAACVGGAGGFADGCWANACGPAVRTSATIADRLDTLAFAATDAVRYVMRSGPLVLTAPWRNNSDLRKPSSGSPAREAAL